MPDVKKIATRVSYGQELAELGAEYDNICVMDADLAASTQTAIFGKRFPERFFDVGIQEGNMMGIAAGLASTSSFAMFATGRAYEIIRNSIAYPRLNVKVCASHAGVSVGEDGASHQCIEDIALMRVIPHMVIIQPADDVETRAALRAAYAIEGPVYLRLARLASPVFNSAEDYKFEFGKGITLRDGSDVTIVATGLPVTAAMEACDLLLKDGISARRRLPRDVPSRSQGSVFRTVSAYPVRRRSFISISVSMRREFMSTRRLLCVRNNRHLSEAC